MTKKKTQKETAYKLPRGKALVLRTCDQNLQSNYGSFQWPSSGPVKCDDWSPQPYCGHGLHGLLWGEGIGAFLAGDKDAKWLVVEVSLQKVVNIDGDKIKFPYGNVVFCGDQYEATKFIKNHGGQNKAIAYSLNTENAGNIGGDYSENIGGRHSINIGGEHSKNIGGYFSRAAAGERGVIALDWYDSGRRRITVGYVGENGIEPNVLYRCDGEGKLIKA